MPIFTVSQISEAIKKTLEGSFSTLQIRGEISNLRLQSSGHYYFTLKDEQSQISCALFRGDAYRLKQNLKDGDQIVVIGNLSVFAPKGTYQIIVKEVQHQGVGDLLVKLEALKQFYKNKGYFDVARKKTLPKFPKKIGVITSPTGAVIQDIIQTLSRRHKGFQLILIPTKVQGDGSSQEIAKAIDTMNLYALCDVIICGRGGGSLEDLWCFNEEAVIEAIYRSKIPIISAVGHETDFTLADFVADVRAATPTAAAELAFFDIQEFMQKIRTKHQIISQILLKKVQENIRVLSQIKKRPEFISSSLVLQNFYFSLDRVETKLIQHFKTRFFKDKDQLNLKKTVLAKLKPDLLIIEKMNILEKMKAQYSFVLEKHLSLHWMSLGQKNERMQSCFLEHFKTKTQSLQRLKELLYSISPANVMKNGYAMVESLDGCKTITSVYDLNENQDLRLKFKDGSCLVKIKEKQLI